MPHPTRWMGKAISSLESVFRTCPFPLVLSGALFSGALIAGTWGACRAVLWIAQGVDPIIKDVLETVLVYYSLSARTLGDSAMAVLKPLEGNRLKEARQKLAQIVGRDVKALDHERIARAAVESVAENLVDGVVSPLFYAAIGGAPLAMAFKMANTLDSMIGYRNASYMAFGKAAARIDDAANFICARLSTLFIALAAQLLAGRGGVTLKTAFREGRRHASPNSGYPEAAFAGALGVTLGGPGRYQGVLVHKPVIGAEFGRAQPVHIRRACDLMLLSALLWAFFASGFAAVTAV